MDITLDSLVLPRGLRWDNEFAWKPIEQNTSYTIMGSLVVQEGLKLKGREIILSGGLESVWIIRSDLLIIYEMFVDYPTSGYTLTIFDKPPMTVLPTEITSNQVPIHPNGGYNNPEGGDFYYIDRLSFIEI